jgi:hypothetical protein
MSPTPATSVDREPSHDARKQPRAGGHRAESLPRWSTLVVILAAALTGAGGAIAAIHPTLLTPPHTPMNAAARVYAGYTLSRDLAIAVALLVLLACRARRGLAGMLLFVALIQIIDIAVDAVSGRLALLPGLGALVLLLLSAAWQLTKATTTTESGSPKSAARINQQDQPGVKL